MAINVPSLKDTKKTEDSRSYTILQRALFLLYLVTMLVLISSVIEEPISGVVILIFGIPITGAYIVIAGVASILERAYNNKKDQEI